MYSTSPVYESIKTQANAGFRTVQAQVLDCMAQLVGPQLSALFGQILNRKHLTGHWAASRLVDLGFVILPCSTQPY